MSLARLWLSVALALPVLAAVIAPMSTVDLAYHLRAGAEIVADLALPTVDTWTFTAAGLPWVDQQWGAQVLLRAVYDLGGLDRTGRPAGAARPSSSSAVSWSSPGDAECPAGRRRCSSSRRSSSRHPRSASGRSCWGWPASPSCSCWSRTGARHPGRLWFVPLVVLLWANLHGSFFLGPVVLGLAWLEDLADGVPSPHRTLLIAGVSALAACVTPFGPRVWTYAIGLSVNPEVTARITEWQPTSLRTVAGLLFFASVAGVVILIARRGRVVAWPTLLWLAVFAAIGLYAERGIAWWPLAAVAAIAGTLIPAAADPTRVEPVLMRRLNVVVVGALVLAAVVLLPAWRPVDPRTGAPDGLLTDAPPALTEALRAVVRPGDHVFNPQPWGSWFEFAVPDARYAIDSRIELFPAEVWDQYEAVVAGVDGWQEQLDAWDVAWSSSPRTRRSSVAGSGRLGGRRSTRTRPESSSPGKPRWLIVLAAWVDHTIRAASRWGPVIGERFDPTSNGLTVLRLGLALAVLAAHVWDAGGYGPDPIESVVGRHGMVGNAVGPGVLRPVRLPPGVEPRAAGPIDLHDPPGTADLPRILVCHRRDERRRRRLVSGRRVVPGPVRRRHSLGDMGRPHPFECERLALDPVVRAELLPVPGADAAPLAGPIDRDRRLGAHRTDLPAGAPVRAPAALGSLPGLSDGRRIGAVSDARAVGRCVTHSAPLRCRSSRSARWPAWSLLRWPPPTAPCGRLGDCYRSRVDLSYGTYLLAFPITQILLEAGLPGPWPILAATVVLTLPIAAVSWFLVERPMLRVRVPPREPTLESAPAPAT